VATATADKPAGSEATGRKRSLGRRLRRSFGAPEPLAQAGESPSAEDEGVAVIASGEPDEPTSDEGVVVIAGDEPDEKTSSGGANGSKTEVFVVSAPVASEAVDESESDDSPAAEDQSAARRSGTAGTRRKRRPDVTRNPRTRGRSAQGDGGSTKSDHASDGPSRTDSPRETS
jgi:hypothetical protein